MARMKAAERANSNRRIPTQAAASSFTSVQGNMVCNYYFLNQLLRERVLDLTCT